jgi:hypothetical protein
MRIAARSHTEHGAIQAANVLNSPRAAAMGSTSCAPVLAYLHSVLIVTRLTRACRASIPKHSPAAGRFRP